MSIQAILKKAPLDVLQDYAKQKRPTKWICPRCGSTNKLTSLRCKGYCGLGIQSKSTDSPAVWDAVQTELKRRKK